MGGSEDVATCYDRASAVGGHLSWRHQPHLHGIYCDKYFHLGIYLSGDKIKTRVLLAEPQPGQYLCPTCQGYSFSSVSCPPTILVRLLAWPQVQVLVLPLGMVVAGGGVVDTGEGVVVEANIIYYHFNETSAHS